MLLAFAFFGATCLLIFQSLEVQYSEKFLDRFSGLDGFLNSPSRWAKMEEGLTLLSPYELVSGAGLTSVMFSGPHNDYIRWIQRVGVVMALLAFAPYAYLFFQNILRGFSEKRFLSEFSFLAGLCLFTLYHSFFGYPRDDAFQALVCFLALGVSVGFARWVRASRTNGSASEKHI